MINSEKKAIAFLTAIKTAMEENDVHSIVFKPGINEGNPSLEICIDGFDETLESLRDEDATESDTLTSFLTIVLKNPTALGVYEHTIDHVIEKLEKGVSFLHDADLLN